MNIVARFIRGSRYLGLVLGLFMVWVHMSMPNLLAAMMWLVGSLWLFRFFGGLAKSLERRGAGGGALNSAHKPSSTSIPFYAQESRSGIGKDAALLGAGMLAAGALSADGSTGQGMDEESNGFAEGMLDSTPMDSSTEPEMIDINPATGLPMVGGIAGIDVAGNPYGVDLDSGGNDTWGGSSPFDDSWSSGSSFDDSWSSSSFGNDSWS